MKSIRKFNKLKKDLISYGYDVQDGAGADGIVWKDKYSFTILSETSMVAVVLSTNNHCKGIHVNYDLTDSGHMVDMVETAFKDNFETIWLA